MSLDLDLDLSAIEARRKEAVDYCDGGPAEAWADSEGTELIAEVRRLRRRVDLAEGALEDLAVANGMTRESWQAMHRAILEDSP